MKCTVDCKIESNPLHSFIWKKHCKTTVAKRAILICTVIQKVHTTLNKLQCFVFMTKTNTWETLTTYEQPLTFICKAVLKPQEILFKINLFAACSFQSRDYLFCNLIYNSCHAGRFAWYRFEAITLDTTVQYMCS